MTSIFEHEVLWLRKEKIIESQFTHAVLWPVYEFRVLNYESLHQRNSDLNPFERAIVGLAENGICEIKKQADLLALSEEFIAHIHTKLVSTGKIDSDGKPRFARSAINSEEKVVARCMYQDPWTGSMWPRSIESTRRQTVLAESDEARPTLIVGTTGDPIKIRTFEVSPPEAETKLPTADDIVNAIRSWMKIESQQMEKIKRPKMNLRLRGSPKTKKLVYLVCPNRRNKNGNPIIEDPFGCPSWSVFVRHRKNLSQELPAFGRWLNGDQEALLETSPAEEGIFERFQQLERLFLSAESDSVNHQVYLDLQDLSHRLVEEIIDGAPNQNQATLNCLVDPLSDVRLLEKLARMFGFDSDHSFSTKDDVKRYRDTNYGTLSQKCAMLLLYFRPEEVGGLLHSLAKNCPKFFYLVKITESSERPVEKIKAQVRVISHLFEARSSTVGSLSQGDEAHG